MVFHFGFTLCFSNDTEDISVHLLTICIASSVKHLFKSLVHLKVELFVFLVRVVWVCYIFWIQSLLSDM